MRLPIAARAGLVAGLWLAATALNLRLLPPRYGPHARVERAKAAPLRLVVRAPGTLQAKNAVTLKAEFEGPVVKKAYREGESVQSGQLLVEIGREKIQSDHQFKVDALKNAEEDLRRAKKEVKVQAKLFKMHAVARSAVDEAGRAVGRAEQAVQMANATYRSEMERWGKNLMTAPFAGTVVKDSLQDAPGVGAGMELLTLADVSEYAVQGKVDELQIGQLKTGQEAEVRVQAYESMPLKATLAQIGTQAEGSSLPEVPVKLVLKETGGLRLLPKMSAEARIFTGDTEPVFSVPVGALTSKGGEPYVWVLDRFGRLRERRVATGRSTPERVEVREGLAEGERVCASAEPDWVPGVKVLVDE